MPLLTVVAFEFGGILIVRLFIAAAKAAQDLAVAYFILLAVFWEAK